MERAKFQSMEEKQSYLNLEQDHHRKRDNPFENPLRRWYHSDRIRKYWDQSECHDWDQRMNPIDSRAMNRNILPYSNINVDFLLRMDRVLVWWCKAYDSKFAFHSYIHVVLHVLQVCLWNQVVENWQSTEERICIVSKVWIEYTHILEVLLLLASLVLEGLLD